MSCGTAVSPFFPDEMSSAMSTLVLGKRKRKENPLLSGAHSFGLQIDFVGIKSRCLSLSMFTQRRRKTETSFSFANVISEIKKIKGNMHPFK